MKTVKKSIRIADGIFAFFLVVIYSIIAVGNFILPDDIKTYSSGSINYGGIFSVSAERDAEVDYQQSSSVSAQSGEIKLLGIFPVKKAEITRSKTHKVFVSGESFGIKLYTDGVIIVGLRSVETEDGKKNPAKDAGLRKGDIITEINGEKMYSASAVTQKLNDNNGKEYKIKVKRNGNYKTFSLKPVYSESQGVYKVGLWVRDSTAGVGTVTFFDKSTGGIAALGHPITDVDTGEIMPILEGEAVETVVTKIIKSTSGEAGSLCCEFTDETIAKLSENSESGIFGKYVCDLSGTYEYEIASPEEVEKGAVQILCTIDDGEPKLYNAEITRISYRENNSGKNMVIKITDSSLIEKTGGIVQGMSGSPIIQNGKLIGALTHVIVDNPQKGYAIFAQTMYDEIKTLS